MELGRPDLDTVREAMREHDEREHADEAEHEADETEPRDEDDDDS